MDTRIERVVLETGRYRIVGDLRLPSDGYRSRLSDFLNRGETEFIPLTNVKITTLDGEATVERPFIAVAATGVEIAYPLDS